MERGRGPKAPGGGRRPAEGGEKGKRRGEREGRRKAETKKAKEKREEGKEEGGEGKEKGKELAGIAPIVRSSDPGELGFHAFGGRIERAF